MNVWKNQKEYKSEGGMTEWERKEQFQIGQFQAKIYKQDLLKYL